jgi:hypothetical protein
MKVLILALFCVILISGCTEKVKFTIETTECNTYVKDTVVTYEIYISREGTVPVIETNKEAVPVFTVYNEHMRVVDKKLNVCKIKILKEEVVK